MDQLADPSENTTTLPRSPLVKAQSSSCERHSDRPARRRGQDRLPTERSPLAPSQRVTLEDLASQIRIQKAHTARCVQLRRQKESITQQIALGARLLRVQKWTRRALVKYLRNRDKLGFVECFHSVQSLKDTCLDVWKTRYNSQNGTEDESDPSPLQPISTPLGKLTARARAELQELLRLVRNEPSFLVDRLHTIPPALLNRLVSSPDTLDKHEPRPGSAPHSRNTLSSARRSTAFLNSVKDHISSLERNDPISTLLHNVWNTNQPLHTSEAEQRLDTWSTVCATLFKDSDESFGPLICRILTEYAHLSEWRARPRLEAFLRSSLQEGAFLLGYSKSEFSMSDYAAGIEASLQTRQAIEFFERSIQELFSILDDEEGGLPRGSLELGSAILGKLNDVYLQGAFRGFLLYSWFFGDFLKSFVVEPEAHGALLDQYIRTEARDRVLSEIGKRAHAVVYMVFEEDSSFPIAGTVRPNVNRMNNKLIVTDMDRVRHSHSTTLESEADSDEETPLLPLILAPADLISLIDALYPRVFSFNNNVPDPFLTHSALSQENSPSEQFPYPGTAYGTMYLHDNVPIHAKARPTSSATSMDFAYPTDRHQSRNRPVAGGQRFDSLRRDLEILSDGGASIPPLPHHDSWIPLDVQRQGRISLASVPNPEPFDMARAFSTSDRQSKTSRRRNITVDATLRLADGLNIVHGSTASSIGFDRFSRPSTWLEQMFEDEVAINHAKSDSAAAHYWWTALRHIRDEYPVCCLSGNDTKILQPLILESSEACERSTVEILALERQVAQCQGIFVRIRDNLNFFSKQLNDCRDKMWYVSGVRDSPPFEHARTITTALNNMWLPETQGSSNGGIVGNQIHSRPSSSSLLHQAEMQTTDLLKAPAEHGGPKKLADDQIEWVKRWMESCGIENFCTGEERFHRFCLEIRETVNKLAGDTLLDGRFLWSSELFARERSRLDIFSNRSTSAHTATRPPSVVSDEGPLRGQDFGSRAASIEPSMSPGRKGSFHGFDRWRAGREALAFDTASASDSPGRTISTVPSDSYTGFWSPAVTQAQSATSVYSNHSRPPSVHTDLPGIKVSDSGQNAKVIFLQNLRSNLVSLLLSDLCCPVWSTGCETDAWISDVLNQPVIRQRLRKRASIEKLLSNGHTSSSQGSRPSSPRLKSKRSMSAGPESLRGRRRSLLSSGKQEQSRPLDPNVNPDRGSFSFATAFSDIVQRFSAEADPRHKLQSLKDLKNLVTSSLNLIPEEPTNGDRPSQSQSRRQSRRWSQPMPSRQRNESFQHAAPAEQEAVDLTEDYPASKTPRLSAADAKVIDRMKKIFMDIKPRTLFRDLQLVSTFTDPVLLAEPDNAKALLLTGLAALAFKEDVCRTMVGIADKVIMQDSVKRRLTGEQNNEFSLVDAINFWIICAKEGNAIAQREIATLYLTHSSFLPKASAPMTLSRDTFNTQLEMSLRNVPERSVDESAMKLAVHWMQLAASNGDKLAQTRLQTVKQQDS